MALGDGIRRNIAKVSQVERDRFHDALVKLDMNKFYPDGVSYWDKQDQIHQATHVHGGSAFLPWHRELCNRFEALLRAVDPDLSLHYWDWTTDPRASDNGSGGTTNLFTSSFMGSPSGRAGTPLGTFDNNGVFAGSRDQTGNPADPPQEITRSLASGAPSPANIGSSFKTDADMVVVGDALPADQQYNAFRTAAESMHNSIHGYIGGTIGSAHSSFEDPFVFLLHSNVDRLLAMWQTQPGKTWRLDPDQVYGNEGNSTAITENLEPWAGGTGTRPWAPPENEQVVKNSKHPSVVLPPCYDTLPTVPASVTLDTPTLTFNDVPAGETTVRAAVFSVISCDDVHLEITSGPTVLTGPIGTTFGVLLGSSITVPHTSAPVAKGRLWISFTGTSAGDMATGTVTIHCTETGQNFVLPITANTIARPSVAVVLSLDQSGSMNNPAGTLGATRMQVLKEAASRFVEVIQPNNGIGIVRFDHDAYPGFPVTRINTANMFDPDRVAALGAVQAHNTNPAGFTSIGDGVALARTTLNPVTGYDQKAILVFTDGLENRPQYIADVMGSIDNRTFAIGLGSETQVSTAALTALTNGTGGYLLLTGHLTSDINDYFRLTKYFLQILAGVTNTNIVLDPTGFIHPGMKVRIPFQLNETDIDSTVLLLTDLPAVRLAVEAPDGSVMDPGVAASVGAIFAVGTNMAYYRFTLPVALGKQGAHSGTWHALLEVDERLFKKHLSKLDNQPEAYARARAHGARYSLNVHATSNLRIAARLSQTGLEPGATMTLRAALTEYGLPVERRAAVRSELQRPDGTLALLSLAEVEPGVFETILPASLPGLYRFRVLAAGATFRGLPFTREQLLTGAVFQRGDRPLPTSADDPRKRDEEFCRLIECLLENESLRKFAAEHHLDLEALARCVRRFCEERLAQPPESGGSVRRKPPKREIPTQQELNELLSHPKMGEILALLTEIVRKEKM